MADNGVTPAAVEAIIEEMIKARRVEDLHLPGLGAERAPVFAGGIAILAEIMSTLRIERLDISSGALREGLLYDMLGRLHDEDARERSIRAMQRRYHVDLEQAARVEATAAALLEQVARGWQLADQRYRQLLVWAARLHEVGLDIAHARYHHHGGYLVANSDLPGFVRLEQQLLACLVTLHRRKLDDPFLDELPSSVACADVQARRAVAARDAAESQPQPLGFADDRARARQGLARARVPAGMARRQSADRGRSRARGRLGCRRAASS